MAKGDTVHFDSHDFPDPVTGVRVTRLTPPGMNCLRTYFYQKCFTDDGRELLMGSEQDGAMNLWMLDLESGQARQLSEGQGDNVQGAYLSPDGRKVYFTRAGSQHIELDLASLAERVVYTVPDGWLAYGTWVVNAACTRVVGIELWADDQVRDASGWERFARQFAVRPRQRLIEIDLASGTARTVREDRLFIGHPMYRPSDDRLMGFCHEGPHDLVDARIWFINSDGSGLRKVKEHAPGESCMHEFWVPDGSRLIYVSYLKGETTRSIWSVEPVTLSNERIMDMPPCAHLMSNHDGSLLVGDGAGQLGDVADKAGHAFTPDPRIHLFDLRNRTHRPVCLHNSSWAVYRGNTQASHPHPSFSPDGQRVLFASDSSGTLALYLADLPELS